MSALDYYRNAKQLARRDAMVAEGGQNLAYARGMQRFAERRLAASAAPGGQPKKPTPPPTPAPQPPPRPAPMPQPPPGTNMPTIPPNPTPQPTNPVVGAPATTAVAPKLPTLDDAAGRSAAQQPVEIGTSRRKKYGVAATTLTGELGLSKVGSVASRTLLG